jgi:Zn-dependent protease
VTPDQQEPAPPPAAPPTLKERLQKLFAPIAAIGVALAKYGAILFKLKFFTLFFSMLASVGAYALAFGWQFAVGFVLLIFVHEMGHVIVLRARGISAGLPVFLPFLGAFVTMKESPRTAYDEALSGIAGPVFGAVGAFAVLGLAEYEGSDFLRALAYTGFLLNLFNLLPFLPLDGGRTAAAVSPKLWVVGLAGLLAYEIVRPSPIIPLILLLGGFETYRRWRGRDTAASRAYFALTPQQRLTIATAYLGLITVLIWAMHTYPVPDR